MPVVQVVFAYLGPETILPVTSILAATAGFVLMFWRTVLRLFLKVFAGRFQGERRRFVPRPHFVEQQPDEAALIKRKVSQ